MDPDFGIYVKDKKKNILGVLEIRKGLIDGSPMKIIHTGRSALKKIRLEIKLFLTKIDYFWFLSEFIFKIRCPKVSKYNLYSETDIELYELIPENYKNELVNTSQLSNNERQTFFINDEILFWEKPTKK
jgi:hypothetical protein